MRLLATVIPNWPKLAWVAAIDNELQEVHVICGPMVEIGDEWIVEAVWGYFSKGDFDRTDLIFGSGVRVRGDEVVFVSSGSTLDRLWHCQKQNISYAANSLPALMRGGGCRLNRRL